MKLTTITPTERVDRDDGPVEIGQWYWVKDVGRRPAGERWLGCVSHVGSNFVELTSVNGSYERIHFDSFDDRCERTDPTTYVAGKIDRHQGNVRSLMDDIRRLTAQLGVGHRDALSTDGSQALAVAHGVADVKAHKAALIKAKTETLPDLFKRVEEEHQALAMWMKAGILPMRASLKSLQSSVSTIEDRIFTVELYAGLTEDLERIQEGEPAPNDTKVAIFQRRHYMDEECLANYTAGGMEFKNISAFDGWLLQPDNLKRILPLQRCVVAFQVRRKVKEREVGLGNFIQVSELARLDKATFLYIRNGDQVYRLMTSIDFGEQLFPDVEQSAILGGGNLWIKDNASSVHDVLSQRQYDDVVLQRRAARGEMASKLWAWKKVRKLDEDGDWVPSRPWAWKSDSRNLDRYAPCTPESVYYDDALGHVKAAATEQNRVAVVLQGLLDRSPAFHPHPPWRLWTPEGFQLGIDLIYDDSKALTDGPAPDFQAYFDELAKSIKTGSMTIGQDDLWLEHEQAKEDDRRALRGGRARDGVGSWWRPHGNPGPGDIAEVKKMTRAGLCSFAWERRRERPVWVPAERHGYRKHAYPPIPVTFSCPREKLFNVSAYKAGDYKRFYADPRTRAEYLEWAPFLLAAEDWVNGKHKSQVVDPEESEDDSDE